MDFFLKLIKTIPMWTFIIAVSDVSLTGKVSSSRWSYPRQVDNKKTV